MKGRLADGARRDKDVGNRPIDTNVTTIDNAKFSGLSGLRDYLVNTRREAFIRQFVDG